MQTSQIRELVVTVGLPGSGKSTWADKQARKNAGAGLKTMIVCKDDIRKQFEETGWKWSPEAEKAVIAERDSRIKTAFGMDIDVVIVADTNFGKHKAHLQELAKQLNVYFRVRDFTNVPVETCIERDARREKKVGEAVIRGMWDKYIVSTTELYTIPDAQKAIICDLDGTLALLGDRSPYDTANCDKDRVNEPVSWVLFRAKESYYKILFTSGREDKFRPQTEAWLDRKGFDYLKPYELFMRTTGDFRKDYVVKLELFNQHIRKNYAVQFVLDDRNQVVRMWRKLGLTCFQVAEGDF